VNHWHRLGMPKEQIVVGLPAYGRTWSIVASDVIPPPGTPAEALGTVSSAELLSFVMFIQIISIITITQKNNQN